MAKYVLITLCLTFILVYSVTGHNHLREKRTSQTNWSTYLVNTTSNKKIEKINRNRRQTEPSTSEDWGAKINGNYYNIENIQLEYDTYDKVPSKPSDPILMEYESRSQSLPTRQKNDEANFPEPNYSDGTLDYNNRPPFRNYQRKPYHDIQFSSSDSPRPPRYFHPPPRDRYPPPPPPEIDPYYRSNYFGKMSHSYKRDDHWEYEREYDFSSRDRRQPAGHPPPPPPPPYESSPYGTPLQGPPPHGPPPYDPPPYGPPPNGHHHPSHDPPPYGPPPHGPPSYGQPPHGRPPLDPPPNGPPPYIPPPQDFSSYQPYEPSPPQSHPPKGPPPQRYPFYQTYKPPPPPQGLPPEGPPRQAPPSDEPPLYILPSRDSQTHNDKTASSSITDSNTSLRSKIGDRPSTTVNSYLIEPTNSPRPLYKYAPAVSESDNSKNSSSSFSNANFQGLSSDNVNKRISDSNHEQSPSDKEQEFDIDPRFSSENKAVNKTINMNHESYKSHYPLFQVIPVTPGG